MLSYLYKLTNKYIETISKIIVTNVPTIKKALSVSVLPDESPPVTKIFMMFPSCLLTSLSVFDVDSLFLSDFKTHKFSTRSNTAFFGN